MIPVDNEMHQSSILCAVNNCRSFEKFMFLVEQAHWYYEVPVGALLISLYIMKYWKYGAGTR